MTTLDERPAGLDETARAALFGDARTANSFASTPVTDEQLAQVWELARWAPTAANLQPARVLYVRTPEAKARLVPLLNDTNRDRAASAPVTAVLALDERFHDAIPTVAPFLAGLQPVLEEDTAMRSGMGSYSAALQAGYFILAVRALGLAAGPMAGFDRDAVDAEFFAGTTWRSHLVVNIGYPGPDAFRPRLPRLAPEDVVRYA
ncbi:3-hydroxypropanoate dehydrogenase [Kineococcus radiotolerans]|uniref:Nitroreductase n=2 Tax=Kineococcus radiotolerans TaxID=131568 RepID=A6WDV9_KINRD|nr:malonic semialdehyde reductase [Kineococcus radiotolerans]ABS04998.1 nitroreductase [Kineococcus radiotolerans SRS30216 = ATCC BAA-149]MBB2901843.1 3-hydroxypropanoate dehydrogenase [Kineococcus radiotolerans]